MRERRVFTLSTVETWLDANDEKDDDDDERRETLTGLLVKVMSSATQYCRERHVKLARRLLARGADPNPLTYGDLSPLHAAATARGPFSLDLVEALLASGAAPNARTAAGAGSRTPRMGAIEALSLRPSRFPALAVVRALLRGGARIDRVCGSEDVEMRMWRIERLRPEVCEEQNWIACRDTFDCIRAAGSWKAFVRRPHVDLFVLRALVVRGRAKTRDANLRRLVTLPNPVLWRVLNYWRATS